MQQIHPSHRSSCQSYAAKLHELAVPILTNAQMKLHKLVIWMTTQQFCEKLCTGMFVVENTNGTFSLHKTLFTFILSTRKKLLMVNYWTTLAGSVPLRGLLTVTEGSMVRVEQFNVMHYF